jgi:hypothetical protein
MEDAVADGMAHPMVVRLSRLRSGQHAHASMMALLRERTPLLDDIRRIPSASGETGCHMLAPSAIIRRIYANYPHEFRRRLGADDPARVRSFWEQLYTPRNHKWLREHSILRTLSMDDLQYVIPLALHEDAAPVTKRLGANTISFSSVLAEGNEKLTHFLSTTYIKRVRAEAGDHTPMWNALLADFEALSTGIVDGIAVAPIEGVEGGCWKFLLLFSKADEEVRCGEWGMVSYSAADEVCSECTANRTTRPWTDMRRGASWRGTEIPTLALYIARCRTPVHRMVGSRFFWRFFFYLDTMHMLDCKGVASSLFGSMLSVLIRDDRLGGSQQVRLDRINQELKDWYSARPGVCKLPTIMLSNLTGSSGWAELAGPAIKAASTRASAPFFAMLARRYYGTASPFDTALRKCSEHLAMIYEIIQSATMFFTDAELQSLQDAVGEFGIGLQSLRGLAAADHSLLWQVRPKAHKAMHIPFFANIINPSAVNCYADESQMGTSQKVWRASVKGKYQQHIQRSVLAKRWLALVLRFEQDR